MTYKTVPVVISAALVSLLSFGGESEPATQELNEAARSLKAALEAREFASVSAELSHLSSAAEASANDLGIDHLGADLLRKAAERAKNAPSNDTARAVKDLRSSLKEVLSMLTFKPVEEAEVPEGFPEWTPIGQIEVKQYPTYRMARYEMKENASDNSAFFTLFRHIKRNNIEMTAPVEMQYDADAATKMRQLNMAFLYESATQGSLEANSAGVKVVDVPAQKFLSIGMRGATTDEQIEAAHQALQSWLEQHKTEYAADGPLRVMGHNSPFVFGNRRYFEVQIPLREAGQDTEVTDGQKTAN